MQRYGCFFARVSPRGEVYVIATEGGSERGSKRVRRLAVLATPAQRHRARDHKIGTPRGGRSVVDMVGAAQSRDERRARAGSPQSRGSSQAPSAGQAPGPFRFHAVTRAGSSPNRTETSFDTPGSCMVTPYMTGEMPMVFLLWVMMTN